MMTAADEFVSLLLAGRSMSHVAHWATDSFSKHIALGEFYDKITELTDAFVEQYQGYYEKRMAPKVEAADDDGDIIKFLDAQAEWVERNRFAVCDKNETPLQNSIDEIVRQYQTTLYKLRMLK